MKTSRNTWKNRAQRSDGKLWKDLANHPNGQLWSDHYAACKVGWCNNWNCAHPGVPCPVK